MSPGPPDAKNEPLDAVLPRVRTGDIFVFHCDALESRVIDTVTDSWFSHVAMAVRHPGSDQVLIWQTDPGPIVTDPLTGDAHAGAQLGDLADAVETTARTWGDQPFWRALDWERPAGFEDLVGQALSALDGTKYPGNVEMVLDYLLGRIDEPSPDTAMFCSEMIAATYRRIGLLGDAHPHNFYAPKDFSSETGATLPLLRGARLAPEVKVLLPDPPS